MRPALLAGLSLPEHRPDDGVSVGAKKEDLGKDRAESVFVSGCHSLIERR